MKPIRLNTIGKVVWFFLIVIVIVIALFVISLFKKDKPKQNDLEPTHESEKIIDYTASKNYTFDFSNGEITKNITIKESGSYKLVGTDDDYKIIIDSPSSVIKIILSNFHSSVIDNLIYVKNAHEIIIELEDGTENTIILNSPNETELTTTILKTKANLNFVGTGKLAVETDGNFAEAKNVNFKDATLELNNVKNGFKIDGDLVIESGNFYIKASEDAVNSKGNVKVENGLFVIRAGNAITNDGLFMINKGKVFIASPNEIKKPNADSLQKTLLLNFKEATKKMLFVNENGAFINVYIGELEYQHILYSDEFKTNELILYESGKVSGEEKYGMYKVEEAEGGKELTCETITGSKFEIKDIVNIYDDVVKK